MSVPFRSEKAVSVLAIGHSGEHRASLLDIFNHSNWKIRFVESMEEARPLIAANSHSVILCQHRLLDGKWLDVLEAIGSSNAHQRLIVSAENADESLWAEVLNLGGYDVLEIPFQPQEVVRVLSLAWLHWRKAPMEQTRALIACTAS